MPRKFKPNKKSRLLFSYELSGERLIDRYFGELKNLHEGGLSPSFSAGFSSLSAGGTFKEEPKGCRAVVYLRTATLDSVSRI
jgi:hypothetical protein